jgi:putative membrane protein
MVTMLDKQYKDDYTPTIIPDNQQMVDELKGKSGKDYSRTFLANVIKHHEQAVKMIDDYLPTARNAEVKSMAEKMKADQTKEIAKFQKKLAAT